MAAHSEGFLGGYMYLGMCYSLQEVWIDQVIRMMMMNDHDSWSTVYNLVILHTVTTYVHVQYLHIRTNRRTERKEKKRGFELQFTTDSNM